jgi:hypothetical protein
MADVKISGLPASTVPLAGTEVLPIVQGGATKQVSIANVTAGRAIAATSITTDTYKAASSSGGALQNSGGTPQLQWGAGGGNNLSVDVAININPANAAVAISPTGTGTVTINPATASTMNNVAIGGTTPLAGKFTALEATGVTTVQAGTVSAPAITTTGDTNTGIFFPAADTIAFTEGGVEAIRIDASGNLLVGATAAVNSSDFLVANISSSSPVFQGASNAGAYLNFYNNAQTSGGLTLGQGQVTGADNIALVWNNANAPLTFGTNGTERMRIHASSGVSIGDTTDSGAGNLRLGTGNLIIGTSGKGIDFSVTPDGSGTTTSELFADYEEGTFTPTYAFTGGGGSITHSATQFGTYRKIGKMVYCTIVMSTTSATLGTGDVQIDGLPYLLHSSAVYRNGCGSIGLASGWVTLAPVQTYMIENLARLYLANIVGAATVGLPAANFNTGSGNALFMSFSYPTVS